MTLSTLLKILIGIAFLLLIIPLAISGPASFIYAIICKKLTLKVFSLALVLTLSSVVSYFLGTLFLYYAEKDLSNRR